MAFEPRALFSALRAEPIAFWLLCVYVTVEYIRPHIMYPVLNVGPVAQISLGAMLAGVLLTGLRPRRLGPIEILFIFFSVAVLISGIYALDPSYSWENRNTYLSWVILFFCVISVITTPRRMLLFTLFFVVINFKMSQHATRSFASRGFSFAGWGVAGDHTKEKDCPAQVGVPILPRIRRVPRVDP